VFKIAAKERFTQHIECSARKIPPRLINELSGFPLGEAENPAFAQKMIIDGQTSRKQS